MNDGEKPSNPPWGTDAVRLDQSADQSANSASSTASSSSGPRQSTPVLDEYFASLSPLLGHNFRVTPDFLTYENRHHQFESYVPRLPTPPNRTLSPFNLMNMQHETSSTTTSFTSFSVDSRAGANLAHRRKQGVLWSEEERIALQEGYAKFGKDWAAISRNVFQGRRSASSLKNAFYRAKQREVARNKRAADEMARSNQYSHRSCC